MATLPRELRAALERVVLAARRQAEAGARKALDQLAVAHHEPWPTMTSDQQSLRRRLRARGRQLGDRLEDGGQQGVEHLLSECAYEQWHRMLFARFLAECGLLIEPESGVSVSVEECKELARERGVDWIFLASTFAQGMLPQIFRADDAVLEIVLPAEHRQPIERLLMDLRPEVFRADDSLGWVYQFWQSEEKDRVNESEKKIGADEIPAVTQLFTEDYMVEFLLHNTLGAWWAGRLFPNGVEAASEEEARATVAVADVEWESLRFVQDDRNRWAPAAGTFRAWPSSAREIHVLDPCMGSGHFLVSALPILSAMRMAEEHASAVESCASVIRDNLFGLEIDQRCTQIAAFNLALAAWKLAGWQTLPPLNLACSGLGLNANREDWVRLAGGDASARRGMEQLYDLFAQAPLLGSLINPRKLHGDLLAAGFHDLQPLLAKALAQEQDEVAHELAVTAYGVAKAAEVLCGRFILVTTNVPYLGRGKQNQRLQEYCESNYHEAKADLATCFVERCLEFCAQNGSTALVTTQNWHFLTSYKKFRRSLLERVQWDFVAKLGSRAFETIGGEVVNVGLMVFMKTMPTSGHHLVGLDVADGKDPIEKALALRKQPLTRSSQEEQVRNPDSRIVLSAISRAALLSVLAEASHGQGSFDSARFSATFWEIPAIRDGWVAQQSTPAVLQEYGGCHFIFRWEDGTGALAEMMDAKLAEGYSSGKWKAGVAQWGKRGVLAGQMGDLPCTLYLGTAFDENASVIVPHSPADLPALWAFCASPEFRFALKQIDQSIKITCKTLVKVPFDLSHWQQLAVEKYPHGLPTPESNDATQWLFAGRLRCSEQPLHVAVARLLGYQWPRQTGSSFVDCPSIGPDGLGHLVDQDGIACISSIKGEEPAAERLRAVLAAAYGTEWDAAKLTELLAQVDYVGQSLEDWLRDGFFAQHCEVFHQRPFVWHVWDGRTDGFSALLNYHMLTKANLERLTYAYLGDWIRRQEASVAAGEAGSDARLVAARKLQDELKKIIQGESPYDVFVRWKPLARQPIGWEPDLDDGVRMNIRPFMTATDVGKKDAGILRVKPNVKWDKDRGKEPSRAKDDFPWFWGWDANTKDFGGGSTFDGNRWNDLHYSREFKIAARRRKGVV